MNLKKILALVLVLAMCLSFIPTYAFAEDDGIYVVEEEEPIIEVVDEPEDEPAVEPVEEETPVVPAVEETPAEEPEEETTEEEELFDEFELLSFEDLDKFEAVAETDVAYISKKGYTSVQEAVDDSADLGATAVLNKAVEESLNVTAEGTSSLDGNGLTLTGNITVAGDFNLDNITVVGNITINSGVVTLGSKVTVTGVITMNGGTLTNKSANPVSVLGGIVNLGTATDVTVGDNEVELNNVDVTGTVTVGGKFTMDGTSAGSITINEGAEAVLKNVTVNDGIVINGGEVSLNSLEVSRGIVVNGGDITAEDLTVHNTGALPGIDMKGGTFTMVSGTVDSIMSVSVSGGTFAVPTDSTPSFKNATTDNGAVGEIRGGTFENEPSKSLIAVGFEYKADKSVGLIEDVVARVENTAYTSFDAAVEAGANGAKTIVILATSTDQNPYELINGKTAKIDARWLGDNSFYLDAVTDISGKTVASKYYYLDSENTEDGITTVYTAKAYVGKVQSASLDEVNFKKTFKDLFEAANGEAVSVFWTYHLSDFAANEKYTLTDSITVSDTTADNYPTYSQDDPAARFAAIRELFEVNKGYIVNCVVDTTKNKKATYTAVPLHAIATDTDSVSGITKLKATTTDVTQQYVTFEKVDTLINDPDDDANIFVTLEVPALSDDILSKATCKVTDDYVGERLFPAEQFIGTNGVTQVNATFNQAMLEQALEVAPEDQIKKIDVTFAYDWDGDDKTDQTVYVTAKTGNVTVKVDGVDDHPQYQSVEGKMTYKDGEMLTAQVGYKRYTLEKAIATATDATTPIVMFKDAPLTASQTIEKEIVLDLDNNKITSGSKQYISLTSGGKLTVQNGTIESARTKNFIVVKNGELTVKNAVINGNGNTIVLDYRTAKVNLDTATITDLRDAAVAITCNVNGTVNVTNSTVGKMLFGDKIGNLVIDTGTFEGAVTGTPKSVDFGNTAEIIKASKFRTDDLKAFVPYGYEMTSADSSEYYTIETSDDAFKLATTSDVAGTFTATVAADTSVIPDDMQTVTFTSVKVNANDLGAASIPVLVEAPDAVNTVNYKNAMYRVGTGTDWTAWQTVFAENDTEYTATATLTIEQSALAARLEEAEDPTEKFTAVYQYDWEGKGEHIQQVTIKVDPANIQVMDVNGKKTAFQSVDGKMTYKDSAVMNAEIGRVRYKFADAVTAANKIATDTDVTIKLIMDVSFKTVQNIKNNIVLDLDGNTLTGVNSSTAIKIAKDCKLTIKNGTLTHKNQTGFVTVAGNGELVVEDAVISGSGIGITSTVATSSITLTTATVTDLNTAGALTIDASTVSNVKFASGAALTTKNGSNVGAVEITGTLASVDFGTNTDATYVSSTFANDNLRTYVPYGYAMKKGTDDDLYRVVEAEKALIEPATATDAARTYVVNSEVTNEGTEYTITLSDIELKFISTSDPDGVTRPMDAAWVGIKVFAPATVDDVQLKNAKFKKVATDDSTSYDEYDWVSFEGDSYLDGDSGLYWIGLWRPITGETLKAKVESAADKDFTWTYVFDWNGDGEVDQTVNMVVDTANVKVAKADSNDTYFQSENDVMTYYDGEFLEVEDANGVRYTLEKALADKVTSMKLIATETDLSAAATVATATELDLNGNTLTMTASLTVSDALSITNSEEEGGIVGNVSEAFKLLEGSLELSAHASASAFPLVRVQKNGSFKLNGGTITAGAASKDGVIKATSGTAKIEIAENSSIENTSGNSIVTAASSGKTPVIVNGTVNGINVSKATNITIREKAIVNGSFATDEAAEMHFALGSKYADQSVAPYLPYGVELVEDKESDYFVLRDADSTLQSVEATATDATYRAVVDSTNLATQTVLFSNVVATEIDGEVKLSAKVTAPATINAETVKEAKFREFDAENWTPFVSASEDGFYNIVDINLTQADLIAHIEGDEKGNDLEKTYEYDWNGDGKVDQTVIIKVDPANVTVNNAEGILFASAENVMTYKDGEKLTAIIGEVRYSLAQAIEAANNAATTDIKLIDNAEVTTALTLSKDANLDLDGHTLTMSNSFTVSAELSIEDNAATKGDGIVATVAEAFKVLNGSLELSAKASASASPFVRVQANGVFTLNDAEITSTITKASDSVITATSGTGKIVIAEDSTISNTTGYSILTSASSGKTNVTVNGTVSGISLNKNAKVTIGETAIVNGNFVATKDTDATFVVGSRYENTTAQDYMEYGKKLAKATETSAYYEIVEAGTDGDIDKAMKDGDTAVFTQLENAATFTDIVVVVEANTDIGHVGVKFTAPESVTAANFGNAKYALGEGDFTGEVAAFEDGNGFGFTEYFAIDADVLYANLTDADETNDILTWTVKVAWDGNEETAVTYTINADLANVTMSDAEEVYAQSVDGVITVWNKPYTIKWVRGTHSAATPGWVGTQTVKQGDVVTVPQLNAEAGYVLNGWYIEGTDKLLTISEVGTITDLPKIESDLSIRAAWKVKQVTITIDPNGGEWSNGTETYGLAQELTDDCLTKLGGNATTIDYTKAAFNPTTTVLARENYVLTGWRVVGSNDVLDSLPETYPTEDTTYAAVWVGETRHVNYFDETHKLLAQVDMAYGDMPLTAPSDIAAKLTAAGREADAAKFTALQTEVDAGKIDDTKLLYADELWTGDTDTALGDSDRSLTLKTFQPATLSFFVVDGVKINGVEDVTIGIGRKIGDTELPDKTTIENARAGYTWSGYWSDGSVNHIENIEEYVIQGNTNLIAVWNSDVAYTVTFITEQGTVEPQSVKSGAYATEPQITADGYALVGWFAEGSEEAFNFANTPITEDIVLTAQWKEMGSATFGYSLSLTDSFEIKFTVRNLTKDPADYTISYSFAGESVEDEVLTNARVNQFTIAQANALQMNENAHVVVKYKGDVIKEGDYSVKKYCEEKLQDASISVELEDLLRATLAYGVNTEYDFGQITSVPAEYDVSDVVIPEATFVKTGDATGVAGTGNKLNLEYRTEILFMMKLANGAKIDDYKATVDGKEAEIVKEGSTYYVVIPVPARLLGKTYEVKIVNTADDTELTYAVSALVGMYRNSNMVSRKALYNYYLAADVAINAGSV